MRNLILFLACTLASGQALRDVVAGTDLRFTASGSTVPTYTMEFRFKANTALTYVVDSLDVNCQILTGLLYCKSNAESNPISVPVVDGTDYRLRFVHDYTGKTNYLYLWTGNCIHAGQTAGRVPSRPLQVAGTWTFAKGQQLGYFRVYTGTRGSAAGCPVDRPATAADIFDFPFEDVGGTAGSGMDRTRGYSISGTPSYVTSATYAPIAAISSSAPKLVGVFATAFTLSAENSRSFVWPGTGAPSSYSWTQTAGPGTCAITNGSTVTPTLNCATATGTTDYTIQLQITDPTPTMATTSEHVGVVTVDRNDNVVISNANYNNAISDGKPLPRYGSSNVPFPWYTTTEIADADLLAPALATQPHMVAGPGTVSLNTGTGAIVGTGTNFTVSDVGQYIEITWDPEGDSSFSGRFVAVVASFTNSTHIAVSMRGVEPQRSFPAGLSWNRMAVGAGTCGTLTASVSGGRVVGISGASGCSGFSWWTALTGAFPDVVLTGGGGSGCNIKANVLTPNNTSDPAQYGLIDPVNPWFVYGNFPCGTGYASAPTVTITPLNEYDGYAVSGQNSFLYNYYEAGLGVGRLALRTGLASHQTEWHNFCTNVWRWSFDSGYNTSAVPRNAAWDMLVACATDPSWAPPGGANAMFAGIERVIVNSIYKIYFNPSSFGGVGEYDARETAYITRITAKLCQLGGSYGLNQATWCGYLAAQEANIWTKDLVNPIYRGSPDTTALYAPVDVFWAGTGWRYPYAGNPPGSNKGGQGSWRDSGLLAIALTDAYDAFVAYGDTTNAAIALNQIGKISEFIWSYGLSPDGGTFYDNGYAANGLDYAVTYNHYIPNQSDNPLALVYHGNAIVTAVNSNTHLANFERAFRAGAAIHIQGIPFTVVSVASGGATMQITPAFSGADAREPNYGNDCTVTVVNGAHAVVGSADCKFTTFFADPPGAVPGSAYIGIVSGGCATGGTCTNPIEARVYGIHITDDTHGELIDHQTSTNLDFLGTSGTYNSFVYVPQSNTNCGVSKSTYCTYGGGRDLSQDVCYAFAWMYAQTASADWKNRAQFCYNKQNGGQALGGAFGGAPNGYTVYSRPGTINISNGSTSVTGVGTQFLTQFPNPGTSKILIAGGMTSLNGQWNNGHASNGYSSATWYTYTVTAVTDDTHLTLSSNFAGTSSSSSEIFYNPDDPQWPGADGGYGILASLTPSCTYNYLPCGGGYDLVPKYGKSLGMVSGAGNAAMGMGILGAGASATGASGAAKARNP